METVAVILMIILFLVLMVFVFSTALLTPIIGKKNLIFVLLMGFIVGIIGGAFFISPIIDDVPNIATSFYQGTSSDLETINLNVSTNVNINQFINDAKNMNGVKNVEVTGITVKTTPFTEGWKNSLQNRITGSNEGIASAQIPTNDTIEIQIQNGTDPQDAINKLKDWLMLIAAISVKYSTVHVSVQTEAVKTSEITDDLTRNAVVTEIEGPTQDRINSLKAVIPDKSNVVILCGFIGVLVGLAGVFIDTLISMFGNLREKIVK